MTTAFDILPAIDLRGGRVVRLEQGDFERETAFSDDPVAVARRFADAGARWLHVVDLDGARTGSPQHGAAIASIVAAVGDRVAVEVAGGLRSPESVAEVLASGAARAVVGTAALRDPSFAGRLVDDHGSARVAVAIDVRDGQAVGEAWVTGAHGVDATETLVRLSGVGVQTFEVTAIDRDGTGSGPDLDLYRRCIALRRGSIVASAGIGSVDDLAAVRALGCRGAVVGRALYDGRLILAEALAASASEVPLEIRRPEDNELLGTIRPDAAADDWLACTIFGGILGRAPDPATARAIVERDGLASLSRRWFHRSRATGDWQVLVIQEAWPGRARAVVGAYSLPGAPVITITARDLDAGDVLTLDPPSYLGLDELRT